MELQIQHQSSSEYSGVISFRIDWFDLLAVQGTLKNLLQPHSSKASILCHSFFSQLVVTHTVKGYSIVNEAEADFNSLAVSMIQRILAI